MKLGAGEADIVFGSYQSEILFFHEAMIDSAGGAAKANNFLATLKMRPWRRGQAFHLKDLQRMSVKMLQKKHLLWR